MNIGSIIPVAQSAAAKIVTWTYDGPYAMYSFTDNLDTMGELMGGGYYAAFSDTALVGYYCFGDPARIPATEKDAYSEEALDIGLGLRPDLCGKGFGLLFLKHGLLLLIKIYNKR